MNINIEEVNCFYMCHMISESFKKDLNGAYDLAAARDTKKKNLVWFVTIAIGCLKKRFF